MAASLEQLLNESRRELLDLSARNRLLSMPVESKSARIIHVRDEKSDHVFRLLVTERKSFAFLPGIARRAASPVEAALEAEPPADFDEEEASLPQPEEDTDEETGEPRRHVDTKLQTSLTSDGLQRQVRQAEVLCRADPG